MTDKEFWEDDPQLYWSYHIFYQKKMEIEREQMKYNCWLQGKINCMAQTIAIANCFGKNEIKAEFPDYYDLFKGNEEKNNKTPEEIDNYVHELNNSWARF